MTSPAQSPQADPGGGGAAAPPGDLGSAEFVVAEPAEPAEQAASAELLVADPAEQAAGAELLMAEPAEPAEQPAGAPWPTSSWSPPAEEPRAHDSREGDSQADDSQDPESGSAGTQTGPDEPPSEGSSDIDPAAQDIDRTLDALTALHDRIGDLAEAAAELTRLRSRDTELIARLHDDVTRLRNGEIASALNPVVTGMIKLHDQMVSLGALTDPASPVGMLHTQLLQILELTCAVRPYTPAPGERFDASRHTGMKRVPTTDPAADGTIAGTSRVGFVRADGSVVRVAEVDVHRLSGSTGPA